MFLWTFRCAIDKLCTQLKQILAALNIVPDVFWRAYGLLASLVSQRFNAVFWASAELKGTSTAQGI